MLQAPIGETWIQFHPFLQWEFGKHNSDQFHLIVNAKAGVVEIFLFLRISQDYLPEANIAPKNGWLEY